jgi:hypothetical protein
MDENLIPNDLDSFNGNIDFYFCIQLPHNVSTPLVQNGGHPPSFTSRASRRTTKNDPFISFSKRSCDNIITIDDRD